MSTYTDKMVKRMRDMAPLDLDKAKKLADEFGSVSYRSIIAKAKSEGVDYIAKAPASKRAKGPTKRELVGAIEKSLGLPQSDRENLTVDALSMVLANIG